MTYYDSPEKIELRKSQEDPIIMYLVVKESLNMSIGKTAAQCAHASQMLLLEYYEDRSKLSDLMKDGSVKIIDPEIFLRVNLFESWLNSSFRKVVLKADNKEWAKLKAELRSGTFVVVVDSGLNELIPNTETVIGLYPAHKSLAPKLIKRLQILK